VNVSDALLSRRSCRAFKPGSVDRETVCKVLEAAKHAPSWANSQPWEVFVAGGAALDRIRRAFGVEHDKDVPRHPEIPAPKAWPLSLKSRIDEAMKRRHDALARTPTDPEVQRRVAESNIRFFDAPIVVYLCMDRSLSTWSIFDLGLFAQSIMLAAEEEGLGTIAAVVLAGYPEIIRSELNIPERLAIVIGLALGCADTDSPLNAVRSTRRPLDDIVTFRGI
jgi:nitroreductase